MRPALTPASKPVLDLPTPEGWKAGLPGNAPAKSRTRDHSITSPTPHHYTTQPPGSMRSVGYIPNVRLCCLRLVLCRTLTYNISSHWQTPSRALPTCRTDDLLPSISLAFLYAVWTTKF